MNKGNIIISGYVQSDNDHFVEGASIKIIDKTTDVLIKETFSGVEGSFRTEISFSRISDVDHKKRTLKVLVHDGNNRLIGQKERLKWEPGAELYEPIKIDGGKLKDYVPVVTQLGKYSGPLNNNDAMNVVRDAVALMYERGTSMYNRFVNGANCPLPPIFVHENIMDAASGVIDGDIYARKELTEILELYANKTVDFETKLDKLVIDGFLQSEVDDRKRISGTTERGDFLNKIQKNTRLSESGYRRTYETGPPSYHRHFESVNLTLSKLNNAYYS